MASNTYHQRVVFAGLSRMTEDRNLILAGYQRWESTSSTKEFDIFEIVADLTKFLGLGSAERKKLMIAMHAGSARLEDELLPVPEYIQAQKGSVTTAQVQSPSSTGTATNAGSAHKVVTERYLQLISQHVKRLSGASFDEVTVILSNEGLSKLPSQLNDTFRRWGADGMTDIFFDNGVSIEECQSCALEFYVLLTEIIGPVDADVIVNKAIAEVSSLQESQKFSPSSLL